MEKSLICPNCRKLISKSCENCGYDSANDRNLINIVISEYNYAIKKVKNKQYEIAFNRLSEAIIIYPYSILPLYFQLSLSIELGYYQEAIKYLNQLKNYFSKDKYDEILELIKKHVNIYNQIKNDNSSIIERDLCKSYAHKKLIKSKEKDKIKNNWKFFNYVSKSNLLYILIILSISILFILKNKSVSDKLTKSKILINKISQQHKNKQNKIDHLKSINKYFNNKNYSKCAEILANNPSKIKLLVESNQQYIIESISEELYWKEKYRKILSIDYVSVWTVHAHYQLINNIKNNTKRIKEIEKFITKYYPNTKSYLAPFIREIFDYYYPKNKEKAKEYSNMMKNYIDMFPNIIEYENYYSNKMKSIR